MSYLNRVPTLLSIARLPIGGLIVLVYTNDRLLPFSIAIGLILIALITDVMDGRLARALGVTSDDGYLLDGLGDRSVYIALILVFYKQGNVWGGVAWLLIFREVAIYAVRVIQVEWSLRLLKTRRLSVAHAFFIRMWFGLVIAKDGLTLVGAPTWSAARLVEVVGVSLLVGALLTGYLSIYSTVAPRTRSLE